MVNSANGREVIGGLRGRRPDVLPMSRQISGSGRAAPIFVLYEQNIGLLTPMIANNLRDASGIILPTDRGCVPGSGR